jgi:hypothetical protein
MILDQDIKLLSINVKLSDSDSKAQGMNLKKS